MDTISLVTIGLAFFAIAISPGPANISNATIAMSQGRKVSLVYGSGLSFGLVVWGFIAASGLGALLQTSVYLLMVLKVLGGLYLIWLAYLSAKSSVTKQLDISQKTERAGSYMGWFIKGFMLNLSNPKTVVAWMAALSVGLSPDANISQLTVGVLVCIVAGFVTNAFYSLIFSLSFVMTGYNKIHRQLNAFFAAVYGLAGIGLIKSAFNKNSI